MATLLEGPFTLDFRDGLVHLTDAVGERVCCSRHDFVVGMHAAKTLERSLVDADSAAVIKLSERGPMFLVERHD